MKTLLVVSLGLFYGGHGPGNSLSSGGFERGIVSNNSSFSGGGAQNGVSGGSGTRAYSSYFGGQGDGVRGGLTSLSGGDGARGSFADSGDGIRTFFGGVHSNGYTDKGDKSHGIQ